METRRRSSAVAASFVVLLFAQTRKAHAHLVTTGLGPFYDGLAHVFVSPEDGIAVLALVLLAGLSDVSTSCVVILTVPIAWFAGGIIGLYARALPLFPWLTIVTFMGLGVLIATNFRLQPSAAAFVAVALGLTHGFMNGSAMARIADPVMTLVGIVTSLFVGAAIITAAVASLRGPWARTGVRALGSWIAAGGLLLLGWALRGLA